MKADDIPAAASTSTDNRHHARVRVRPRLHTHRTSALRKKESMALRAVYSRPMTTTRQVGKEGLLLSDFGPISDRRGCVDGACAVIPWLEARELPEFRL